VLNKLENKNIETIDIATATDVANRAGIDHMILGNISKIGDGIHVTAELIKVKDGAILTAEHEEGLKEDDIFRMANRLAEKFAIKLDVSGYDQISKIQDVTTSSYQAYQFYMQGLDNWWHNDRPNAVKDLEKALEIDPEFAMAYLYLAFAQTGYGTAFMDPFLDRSPYFKTIAKARELSGKVTEKERLYIGLLEAFSETDMDRMYDLSKEFIEIYPKEKVGYFFHSQVHLMRRDFLKAAETLEKVLQMDPAFAQAYNLLAYCYAYMQNRKEATSAARKFIALIPDRFNAYHSGWEAHVMTGMYDEAIQIMEEAGANVPDRLLRSSRYIGRSYLLKGDVSKAREIFHRLQSQWYLSFCSMFEGKYTEAFSIVDGILKSAQEEKNLRGEWSARRRLALILSLQKKYKEAIEEIAKAEKLTQKAFGSEYLPWSVLLDYVNAMILIEMGDYEKAKAFAESIQKKIQDNELDIILMDFYYFLLAEFYIAQNEVQMAAAILEKFTIVAGFTSAHYWHILARIHELQGNWDEAIEIYERSYPNTQLTYWGISDPFYFHWSASLFDYRVGKLYEKKGDVAKAIEHLEKFDERWKDADPGLSELEDVKKRLASLHSQ
jgi:tetratricopeptide (TPR) repeat protein